MLYLWERKVGKNSTIVEFDCVRCCYNGACTCFYCDLLGENWEYHSFCAGGWGIISVYDFCKCKLSSYVEKTRTKILKKNSMVG